MLPCTTYSMQTQTPPPNQSLYAPKTKIPSYVFKRSPVFRTYGELLLMAGDKLASTDPKSVNNAKPSIDFKKAVIAVQFTKAARKEKAKRSSLELIIATEGRPS